MTAENAENAEYPGAQWMPSSHFGYPQGVTGQNTCRWIIVHGTAGFATAQQVGAFFQTNNPPTSVHYVVGRDGAVVQCVQERDAAWGNGVVTAGHAPWWSTARNPNLDTISIEHVKTDPQNAEALTPAQQDASFRLIAYLCAKYRIPARAADASGGITGHFSIDPVNRSFCPGIYPWGALWTYLNSTSNQSESQPMTSSGEVFCAGPLWRESEFVVIPPPYNIRVFGACGPNALAGAASSALGRRISTASVYMLMRARGWCAANGASDIGQLQWAAEALGCKIASPGTWYGPGWNWYPWLKAQIMAGNPSVVETSRGKALVDAISGQGENAVNLQYHFVAIVGYHAGGYSAYAGRVLPEGFWVEDGDNFAGGNNNANQFNAANVLQFYSVASINAAMLVAGLALVGRPTERGTQPMAFVRQPDGTGKDAHGNVVGTGIMAAIEAQGVTADGLLGETTMPAPNTYTFTPFDNGPIWVWERGPSEHGLHTDWGSKVATDLWNLLQAAEKANSGNGTPTAIPEPYVLAKAAVDALSAAQAAK